MYIKDTSAKIKASLRHKGESGQHLATNPPYGYKKDPENPKHWIVDEEAAIVVKQIFSWCMEGYGPSQIARKLTENKVECPSVYWLKQRRCNPIRASENPYGWMPNTIANILEKREYLGHTVNFKTHRLSYKHKKKIDYPPEQGLIFKNTHEAIIDEETFALVQELWKNKRHPTRTGKTTMFSGIVRCADCGEKMYYCTTNQFEARQDYFVCSTSRIKGKEICAPHYIRAVVLEEGVLRQLQLVFSCISQYEDAFRRYLGAKKDAEMKKELATKRKALQKGKNRLTELDKLFKCIDEDMVNGCLSESRFLMLSDDYEREQADFRVTMEKLSKESAEQEKQASDIDKLIRRAKKYLNLEKLTPTVLNDLVNAVYVHAPDKSSGHRVQDIAISYNYIGSLPTHLLAELNKRKTA